MLYLLFGVSSCKEDLTPIRDKLPINISINVNNQSAYNVSHDDICQRFGNMFSSVLSSNRGDRKYLVTLGWNFQFSARNSGQINMVFLGNILPQEAPSLTTIEMINKSIEEHSEENPKLGAELIFYNNGVRYQSILVDRRWAAFGFSDPNKIERLTYDIGEEGISCLENQPTLNFEYSYAGYLYRTDRQDSLLIDNASFLISSQVGY
jgi:hypothetical protein